MRASRIARLPLGIALVAFVAIGGPALAARVEPAADASAATYGRVVRTVEATIADSADTRLGRADRHAPRNHDLPLLLPPTLLAVGLVLLGVALGRSGGHAALARLRGTIGRRAPPAFAPL